MNHIKPTAQNEYIIAKMLEEEIKRTLEKKKGFAQHIIDVCDEVYNLKGGKRK